jgi:hypothetical protein
MISRRGKSPRVFMQESSIYKNVFLGAAFFFRKPLCPVAHNLIHLLLSFIILVPFGALRAVRHKKTG